MKILIDLELDGFESEEAMAEGCYEFVYQALNMTASSVEILDYKAEIRTLEAEVRAKTIEEVQEVWKEKFDTYPHKDGKKDVSTFGFWLANKIRKETK